LVFPKYHLSLRPRPANKSPQAAGKPVKMPGTEARQDIAKRHATGASPDGSGRQKSA
jgi:hypothetical protein